MQIKACHKVLNLLTSFFLLLGGFAQAQTTIKDSIFDQKTIHLMTQKSYLKTHEIKLDIYKKASWNLSNLMKNKKRQLLTPAIENVAI